MIDLDKRCTIDKCWICEGDCTFYPPNDKEDFVLAKPDLIRWKLDNEPFISPSAKALMLDILKKYITGEIVMAEKEKEPMEKETKTYEQGLEDAYELIKRLYFDVSLPVDLRDLFPTESSGVPDILTHYSIHKVKAKFDAWDAEKNKPKLGDVVKIDDIGEFLFLGESKYRYHVLDPNDDGVPHTFEKSFVRKIKKTGKYFDIQGMLDDIKGE